MVLYELSKSILTNITNLVERLTTETKKNYNKIISQIDNFISDIDRIIIIKNDNDINDMLNNTEDYANELIKNPQKLNSFKIDTNLIEKLKKFIDYFFGQIWDFFLSNFGRDKNEPNAIKCDSMENFIRQKTIFLFILMIYKYNLKIEFKS